MLCTLYRFNSHATSLTMFRLLLMFFLVGVYAERTEPRCPNTAAVNKETKPLYLLTLVPFPDSRDGAGWDGGLGTISGARVARDEINNRTDLLPGYHIELIVENIEACSRRVAGTGLTNIVKYTVNPPCRPVVAINGLLCSSHTAILSPIVGQEGMGLLQLSVANAPLFEFGDGQFPHLWRFLGAGSVYADATLDLMDRLRWNRVGLVFDYDSTYYFDVAHEFEHLASDMGKQIVFSMGIFESLRESIFQRIITGIRKKAVTVLIVALSDKLAVELLCRLEQEHLSFPYYTWVHIGKTLSDILLENDTCDMKTILRAKRRHIHLKIQSAPSNNSNILVSDNDYSDYLQQYNEDLKRVQNAYNLTLTFDSLYSSLLHDQVWALALALNKSLPELNNRNLSIEDYTIGQQSITNVIEKHLSNLNFAGASGKITFNNKHGVIPTVQVFMITNESVELLVGTYQPIENSDSNDTYNLTLLIDQENVTRDAPPIKYVQIHIIAAVILYTAAGLTVLFTTVVLALLLYFREWPQVKATSPYLSVTIIFGCYLLCFAAILRTTYAWNDQVIQSNSTYINLVTADIICLSSGLTVVIVATFFKLLRVFHIFFNMKMKLRILWKTLTLAVLILLLSSFNTILVLVTFLLCPPELDFITRHSLDDDRNLTITSKESYTSFKLTNIIALIIVTVFLLAFLLFIVYLAIRMRKIRRNDFKDTKKVNLFVAVLTITIMLCGSIVVSLTLSHNHYIANIVMAVGLLIIPNSVFIILFLPKLIPAMTKPRPKRRLTRRQTLSTIYSSSNISRRNTIM